MKSSAYQNMKLQYRKLLEFGIILSLLFCIFLFQGSKRIEVRMRNLSSDLPVLKNIDIPQTVHEKKKTVIKRPVIPIPSDEFDDIIIETDAPDIFTGWDVEAPPPPDDDPWKFVVVEQQPIPVGGFQAIAQHLEYPEMARLIGHEGRSIIRAKVDEQGNVVQMLVQRSSGFETCDQNAMKAIQAIKWIPAMQRDRPVAVWVSVPVDFKLR